MSLAVPSVVSISGAPFRVGIAAARFNERLVDALLAQVTDCLKASGVKASRLDVVRVPGSNELPVAVQLLASRARYDVLIALGLLIRGDTIHYEQTARATTPALQRVALDVPTPVTNGVVVAENQAQAEARCRGKIDRGAEFAQSALEMAALKRRLSKKS